MDSTTSQSISIKLYEAAFNPDLIKNNVDPKLYEGLFNAMDNMKNHVGVCPQDVEFLMNMMTHENTDISSKATEVFNVLHDKNNHDIDALSLMGSAANQLTGKYVNDKETSKHFNPKQEKDDQYYKLLKLSHAFEDVNCTKLETAGKKVELIKHVKECAKKPGDGPMSGVFVREIDDALKSDRFVNISLVQKGLYLLPKKNDSYKIYTPVIVDRSNKAVAANCADKTNHTASIQNLKDGDRAIIPLRLNGNHISSILVKKDGGQLKTYCFDTSYGSINKAPFDSAIELLGLKKSEIHYCMDSFQHMNCCGPQTYQLLKECVLHDDVEPEVVFDAYKTKVENEKNVGEEFNVGRRLQLMVDIATDTIETELDIKKSDERLKTAGNIIDLKPPVGIVNSSLLKHIQNLDDLPVISNIKESNNKETFENNPWVKALIPKWDGGKSDNGTIQLYQNGALYLFSSLLREVDSLDTENSIVIAESIIEEHLQGLDVKDVKGAKLDPLAIRKQDIKDILKAVDKRKLDLIHELNVEKQKAPGKVPDTLFRGFKLQNETQLHELFDPNRPFIEKSLMSCSTSSVEAAKFASNGTGDIKVNLTISNNENAVQMQEKKGLDEKEYVFLPDTEFTVVSLIQNKKDQWDVVLKAE